VEAKVRELAYAPGSPPARVAGSTVAGLEEEKDWAAAVEAKVSEIRTAGSVARGRMRAKDCNEFFRGSLQVARR
jgi:hypothetical protein